MISRPLHYSPAALTAPQTNRKTAVGLSCSQGTPGEQDLSAETLGKKKQVQLGDTGLLPQILVLQHQTPPVSILTHQ